MMQKKRKNARKKLNYLEVDKDVPFGSKFCQLQDIKFFSCILSFLHHFSKSLFGEIIFFIIMLHLIQFLNKTLFIIFKAITLF